MFSASIVFIHLFSNYYNILFILEDSDNNNDDNVEKRKLQDSEDSDGESTVCNKNPRLSNDMEENVSVFKFSTQNFPPAPIGIPDFMKGVTKVETLDQNSCEAHEAREVVHRLCNISGFIYSEGHVIPASDSNVEEDFGTTKESHKRPLLFRGSQPVSITQRNLNLIVNNNYCVSYKADGTRYFLLIMGPNRVYLIDRANFVYKPNNLHFPTVSWVQKYQRNTDSKPGLSEFLNFADGHFTNTLVDGEMILCHDHSKPPNITSLSEQTGTPRFLIYDLITLNNKPFGRYPFFERYAAIDKQLIWPRNTGGHMGLVDFGIQSFSVRRKVFKLLDQTEEVGFRFKELVIMQFGF